MEVAPTDFFFFPFGSGCDSDHGEPGGFEEGLAAAETSAEVKITLDLRSVVQSSPFRVVPLIPL